MFFFMYNDETDLFDLSFFFCKMLIFEIAATVLFEFSTDASSKYFELISCFNCKKS